MSIPVKAQTTAHELMGAARTLEHWLEHRGYAVDHLRQSLAGCRAFVWSVFPRHPDVWVGQVFVRPERKGRCLTLETIGPRGGMKSPPGQPAHSPGWHCPPSTVQRIYLRFLSLTLSERGFDET